MRLDKFLADMGYGSRSEMRNAVRKGRASVDGAVVRDPGFSVPEGASVALDGRPVRYEAVVYLMLNKPAGVVSATRDEKLPTVLSLLPKEHRRDLFPVGRLDRDTEGLLLLTNDGALAHRLLSPQHHVEKVYLAELDGPVTEREVTLFAEGLAVADEEPFTALPACLEPLGDGTTAAVTLTEGKYHQVKRMFRAVGRTVLSLKRTAMGPLVLDPALAPGEWRPLTEEEMAKLKIPAQTDSSGTKA